MALWRDATPWFSFLQMYTNLFVLDHYSHNLQCFPQRVSWNTVIQWLLLSAESGHHCRPHIPVSDRCAFIMWHLPESSPDRTRSVWNVLFSLCCRKFSLPAIYTTEKWTKNCKTDKYSVVLWKGTITPYLSILSRTRRPLATILWVAAMMFCAYWMS